MVVAYHIMTPINQRGECHEYQLNIKHSIHFSQILHFFTNNNKKGAININSNFLGMCVPSSINEEAPGRWRLDLSCTKPCVKQHNTIRTKNKQTHQASVHA
jgi:hypothetical protein